MESIEANRRFLKSEKWDDWTQFQTDQRRQVPPPPLEQPYPADAVLIDLVPPDAFTVGEMPLLETIRRRRSRRKFTTEPLTLEELSFLLWATQGVEEIVQHGVCTLRTVPSAGARHPFETYLLINHVEGLEPGLYRYLPLEHKLYVLLADPALAEQVNDASYGQVFVGHCAVTFMWTVVPYRNEWRYAAQGHRVIAMDAGHLCQNLYLACESIGAGTCGVGAYDQRKLDAILGVDGQDEFTIYIAPVGKIKQR